MSERYEDYLPLTGGTVTGGIKCLGEIDAIGGLKENSVAISTKYFPVNCVYLTMVNTDPGTLLGFGTWASLSSGKILLDTGDTGETIYLWKRTA